MTADPIFIEPLSPDAEPLWDAYVERHPEGSIYHHLWWRDLFRKSFRYEPCHLVAKRNGTLAGVLPLFKTPTLRGALMTSIPFRDRAAPLADDAETLGLLLQEAVRVAREKGCKTLLLKSPSPLPATAFAHSSDWVRSLMSLPPDRETYRKTINDKTRNMIHQAEKAGLVFSLVASDPAGVAEAVSVLRKTQHRLGIPPFPREYYENLVGILARHGLGEVGAVRHGGRTVAAAILFFERKAAVYAYAGSLPEAWPLRVNDFLVWNAVGAAIERGKTVFDFGSDSTIQEDLLFFKKKWGARPEPLHYYSRRLGSGSDGAFKWRDSSQGMYPALRSVVRRLPGPFYELTGCLTRYFA